MTSSPSKRPSTSSPLSSPAGPRAAGPRSLSSSSPRPPAASPRPRAKETSGYTVQSLFSWVIGGTSTETVTDEDDNDFGGVDKHGRGGGLGGEGEEEEEEEEEEYNDGKDDSMRRLDGNGSAPRPRFGSIFDNGGKPKYNRVPTESDSPESRPIDLMDQLAQQVADAFTDVYKLQEMYVLQS